MKEVFELEWMGGAAEHRFRAMRPEVEGMPWGTLDPSAYDPLAVTYARAGWTDSVISEYRAVTAFTEILRALADARAPLDLLGMAADFLADECAHVEMAARVAMELGGAHPRDVDVERFSPRPRGLTALQRASDQILRTNCVSEAFSAGVLRGALAQTTHPLVHAVCKAILRDESLHCRMGALYFEWALDKIDDAELARLGLVLRDMVQAMRPQWAPPEPARAAVVNVDDLRALGFEMPALFAPVAREIVVRDILDPLETIGIRLPDGERERLMA